MSLNLHSARFPARAFDKGFIKPHAARVMLLNAEFLS
jgi:hypothetical protein